MRTIILLSVFATASPAFAQSRLYTNDDLGKPITSDARLDPADAAAILAPYSVPCTCKAVAGDGTTRLRHAT